MQATIIKTNYGRDMYIFERSDGEYGYFELLRGQDLEIDDVLEGNFTNCGNVTVRNTCTSETIEIAIEDICSFDLACERVFI
ncbi:MAG: hypothetical protein J6J12_07010 [Oscillospiraceae bacterium]|nr:hypothetical protein [Oscillospiraceae bacterium]